MLISPSEDAVFNWDQYLQRYQTIFIPGKIVTEIAILLENDKRLRQKALLEKKLL
jgi:hypothetical protein